jgi:hypothetical protein
MSHPNTPKLGALIEDPHALRDAVHIAVYPATAGAELQPGQRVGLSPLKLAVPDADDPVGIVDPYLTAPVPQGGRFWLCLFPDTVRTLVHLWSAPGFPDRRV